MRLSHEYKIIELTEFPEESEDKTFENVRRKVPLTAPLNPSEEWILIVRHEGQAHFYAEPLLTGPDENEINSGHPHNTKVEIIVRNNPQSVLYEDISIKQSWRTQEYWEDMLLRIQGYLQDEGTPTMPPNPVPNMKAIVDHMQKNHGWK